MSCSRCRSTPCSCAYYNTVSSCPEDHTQRMVVNRFALGLKIQSSWNIPLVGGSAVLSVPGLNDIPVGEYLHHRNYGYFEVISFDVVKQEVTIRNPNREGQASVGTEVIACTTFIITPPPDDSAGTSSSGTYVAIDFTAPAVDTCITITLTSLDGLIAGNLVGIGTGVYRLNQVLGDNLVEICNEGSGILAGSSVIAQVSGAYQYPIVTISVNPCTQDLETSGVVIVCVDDNQTILTGATNGSVLTLTDLTTGEAAYSNTIPTAITSINSSITTINNNITEIETDLGEINTALDPCTLGSTMTTSTYVLSSGNQDTGDVAGTLAYITGINLTPITSFGPIALTTISNPSTCKNLHVTFSRTLMFRGAGLLAPTEQGEIVYSFYEGSATGTIASPPSNPSLSSQETFQKTLVTDATDADPDFPQYAQETYEFTNTFTLAPLAQIKIRTQPVITWTATVLTPDLLQIFMSAKTSYLAVAL